MVSAPGLCVNGRDCLLTQFVLKLRRQAGQDGEQVAHHTVIGDIEDRSLGILVDGYDHFGRAHTGQVLDGA